MAWQCIPVGMGAVATGSLSELDSLKRIATVLSGPLFIEQVVISGVHRISLTKGYTSCNYTCLQV
jgi:hypothetical protein